MTVSFASRLCLRAAATVWLSLVGVGPAAAAEPKAVRPPTAPVATSDPASAAGEPAVRRTVIRDDGTVIEEVRIRGEVRSITVHPKKGSGLPDYEIVPETRGHDPHTNAAGSRGASGQRVWSILKF